MGIWSSIKKAAKKVWRAVKAVVRAVVRIVITIINRLTLGLLDLLFGFLAWPRKRLRLHVAIVSVKWVDPDGVERLIPVVPEQDVAAVIENTKRIYKKLFNVELLPYSKSFIEVLPEVPPPEVLNFKCGIGEDFGIAGEYFADHLAGWNAIPISLTFPVTVFVVRELLGGPSGCSMSVLGEYVIIDEQGLKEDNMIALPHEIGHTCGLWHSNTATNLMHDGPPAGEEVKWFQKNILRSSRHVQWW